MTEQTKRAIELLGLQGWSFTNEVDEASLAIADLAGGATVIVKQDDEDHDNFIRRVAAYNLKLSFEALMKIVRGD